MTTIDRRTLLRAGLAGGVAGTFLGAPAFAGQVGWKPSGRPVLTHGVQSGDATADSAVVWTRADRPGRMWVQAAVRPDFRGARLVRGPVLTLDTDFTGKVRLRHLPADAGLHY